MLVLCYLTGTTASLFDQIVFHTTTEKNLEFYAAGFSKSSARKMIALVSAASVRHPVKEVNASSVTARSVFLACHDTDYYCCASSTPAHQIGDCAPRTWENTLPHC